MQRIPVVPVQDIQDFPALLHAAAGPGVLCNGGDGAQNGRPVLSLQCAAAHDHHRTLGNRDNLETGRELSVRNQLVCILMSRQPQNQSVGNLAEGVCAVGQLPQD